MLEQLAVYHIIPLGKVHEVISRRTLGEAGNLEPAGLAVVARTAVASDCVADDFAAGASGVNLWGVGEVTNDGDLGQRSGSGGAESTGRESRGDGGAAEDGRERHGWCLYGGGVCSLFFFFSLFRLFVGWRGTRQAEAETENGRGFVDLIRDREGDGDFDDSRVVSKP